MQPTGTGLSSLKVLVVVITGFLPLISFAASEKEEFFKRQALSALDGTLPMEYQKSSTSQTPQAAVSAENQEDDVEIIRPEVAEEQENTENSNYYSDEGSASSDGGEIAATAEDYQTDLSDISSTLGVGVISGITSYPGIDNTDKAIPMAGLGGRYNIGWGVTLTGEFLYAYHELEVNRFTQVDTETVDDYMFGLDIGYDWINAFFNGVRSYSLVTGAVLNHRRRQYNLDENASRSFDGGVFVEAGYRINNRLLLAAKWRYMENLSYDRDELSVSQDLNIQRSVSGGNIAKLEEFNSHFLLISLNYLFYL